MGVCATGQTGPVNRGTVMGHGFLPAARAGVSDVPAFFSVLRRRALDAKL